MPAPVLITGGTGTLGRLVASLLSGTGSPVRTLSRHPQPASAGVEHVIGDLASGDGIGAALTDVTTVVHCAGTTTGDDELARTLVRAARAAGVQHLVNVSVVGAADVPVVSAVDRAMFSYFASKRAAELVVADSGLPWTTLRATQFHDLVLTAAAALTKLPVVPVPVGVRFQPVAAADVAARLVELSRGGPAGLVPDLGGPQVYPMADLVRSYLRSENRRRVLLPVTLPGRAARALRGGANLAVTGRRGTGTWEEFLAARAGSAQPTTAATR